jgi:phosphatidate cytidylyltransferase
MRLRIYSALVMVPLAVGAAYVGGWLFAIFWGIAAIGIFWEWVFLVAGKGRRSILLAGGSALVLSLAAAGSGRVLGAVLLIGVGTLVIAATAAPGHRGWIGGGMLYAGATGFSPIVLRSDDQDGFAAMMFLFAVVWATDIAAYVFGRMIGGRRLLPRVSPQKTWSGAISGLAAAVLAAIATAKLAGLAGLAQIACIGAILSAFAQAGDLFESFVKRRFGAKDSSHLIPGHGGLMDRLDGFVAAATIAVLIGIARGGLEAPARGLLLW